MTDPEASSFCIASVHRSACSCGQLFQPPFLFDMLNQTLVSPSSIPLAYSRLRRGSIASLCGILCSIIIAKSVSIAAALVASSFVTNTSLDHRGRLRVSCYKDRRVWKEAQGCS